MYTQEYEKGFFISLCAYTTLFVFLYCASPQGALYKENDANGYKKKALCFLEQKTFSKVEQKTVPVHPRGFPFLIAFFLYIFNGNFYSIILFHFVLSLITIFLTMRSARILISEKSRWLAGSFACLNIGYAVYVQYILMETVVVFLITFALERIACFYRTKNNNYLLQSGLVLGISLWLKPVVLYMPLVVVFWLFLYAAHVYDFVKKSCFFIIGFCFPLGALFIFNGFMYHAYAMPKTLHQNMYLYFLPQIIAVKQGVSVDAARVMVHDTLSYYGQGAVDLFWYIKDNFLLALKVWFFNMCKTALGLYTTQIKVLLNHDLKGGVCSFFALSGSYIQRINTYIFYEAHSLWVIFFAYFEIIFALMRIVLLFFALHGFFDKKYQSICFLLFFALFYFLFITGHDGMARYRMMSEPFLLLLMAYGWLVVEQNIKIKGI